VSAPLPEPFREDHPARIEDVEPDLARFALEKSHQLVDLDAFQAALEQLVHREAPPAIVHRHDDLVDALRLAVTEQILVRSHQALVVAQRREFIAIGHYVADDQEAASVRAAAQPHDARRATARAIHKNAALEHGVVDNEIERNSHDGNRTERDHAAEKQSTALDAQRRPQIDDHGDDHCSAEDAGRNARQQAREARPLPRVVQAHGGHAHEHDSGEQQAVRHPWRGVLRWDSPRQRERRGVVHRRKENGAFQRGQKRQR